jgi:phage-related minor tail protein
VDACPDPLSDLKNVKGSADRNRAVTQRDEPTDAPILTTQDVSARVGEILESAEREAREIIAAARGEDDSETRAPEANTTIEDVARALERLSLRFDAFELATSAALEELGRAVYAAANSLPAYQEPVAEVQFDPLAGAMSAVPEREQTPELEAARVRAIDLALEGYTRESIANTLAVSLERPAVDALLDRVLIG